MITNNQTDLSEFLAAKMSSGLIVLDGNLCIQRVNPALCEIFGLDESTLVGVLLEDVSPLAPIADHLRAHQDDFDERTMPGLVVCPLVDETTRAVRIQFYPVAADNESTDGKKSTLILIDDLSEQEQLRSRARISERGFREIIEHTPDGIAIHRDGKFLYVNPAFAQKFEVDDPDKLVGTWVYEFVHPDERPILQDRVQRMLSTGEHVPIRETILLRADGTEWVADLTGRTVLFDGAPAIASIARDITEKKKLAARMMQMDRMIAAGTLAAGVGHEINNPLSYVATNLEFSTRRLQRLQSRLEILSDDLLNAIEFPSIVDELSAVDEALGDALHGSERIRDIVKQLRTFAPEDENVRKPTRLDPIIDSVVDMAANEIRHRARLIVAADDDIPFVYGADTRLAQVFLNLLINAAHAIDEGAAESNEIRLDIREKTPWVVVEIRDTGSGITDEQLPRIFDPFYTTKAIGQGTGLGLYICQQIVEFHKGRIEVESEPNHGTVVRVLLPAADATEVRQTSCPETVPTSSTRSSILVVDDEPRVGRTIRRMLGEEHDITSFTSAREALEHLIAEPDYDLILCDLMMPEMTGMDFFDRLRDQSSALSESLVFITGGAFTPRAAEFLANSSVPYLEKPLKTEAIQVHIAGRHARI